MMRALRQLRRWLDFAGDSVAIALNMYVIRAHGPEDFGGKLYCRLCAPEMWPCREARRAADRLDALRGVA